ncbi:hypothetical protein ACCQ08_19400 [Comamonas sp. SY3]|uniref:hypothetical protein n=1 Tax=Comamonas sp. SY3 TaxID=3243601 RepID=UPI003593D88D
MKAFIGVDKDSKEVCLIALLDNSSAAAEALADGLILVPCEVEQTEGLLYKTLSNPFDL